jgi:hypothetical protein
MKKRILFALISMFFIVSGCSGTGYQAFHLADSKNALINSTKPTEEELQDFGLRLPLSQRSSVDVDVEGIIDFLKGTGLEDQLSQQQIIHDPWVCFTASF